MTSFLYTDVLFTVDYPIRNSEWLISGKVYLSVLLLWIIIYLFTRQSTVSIKRLSSIILPLSIIFFVIVWFRAASEDRNEAASEKLWEFDSGDSSDSDSMEQFNVTTSINVTNIITGNDTSLAMTDDNDNDDTTAIDEEELLEESGVWNAAMGQVLFSLGLCMTGISSYSSILPKKQDTGLDHKILSFLHLAGVILILYMFYFVVENKTHGNKGNDHFARSGEQPLYAAFAIFPATIQDWDTSQFWGILFFGTVWMSGVHFAASIVNGITKTLRDNGNCDNNNCSFDRCSRLVCVLGGLFSVIFCFDTGVYWLEIIDRYVVNYGLIYLAFMYCIFGGWYYNQHVWINKIGEKSVNIYRYGCFATLLLVVVFAYTLASPEEIGDTDNYNFGGALGEDSWIVALIVGVVGPFIFAIAAVCCATRPHQEEKERGVMGTFFDVVGWCLCDDLRNGYINENAKNNMTTDMCTKLSNEDEQNWCVTECVVNGCHYSTVSFCYGAAIKYIIPICLAINLVATMREDTWNEYAGASGKRQYQDEHLAVGIVVFAYVFILVYLFVFFGFFLGFGAFLVFLGVIC